MTVKEREKLYNEVWAEPVITVAKRYGVSDNGLRKRCLAVGIPLPSKGYWAKLKSGKPVQQQPKLPPLDSLSKRNVSCYAITFDKDVKELSDEELKTDVPLYIYSEESKTLILSICESFQVKTQLRNPNPLITEHKLQIEYREKQKKQNPNYINSPYWFRNISTKSVIDISVSKEQINRAYRIIDSLIKAIEPLEGSISITQCSDRDQCCIHIPDYWAETSLYEETVQEKIKGQRRTYNTIYTGRLFIKFISQLYPDNTLIFTDIPDKSLELQIGGVKENTKRKSKQRTFTSKRY